MMIISALLLDYTKGKIYDGLKKSFKNNVIDRWSRWRSEKFLKTFYQEIFQLINLDNPQELNSYLDKIFQDEEMSEILFDAYRRVSLSRSKTIGPRIIAVVTAKLIYEKRCADTSEEILLTAAETLNDDEFVEFEYFVSTNKKHANSKNNEVYFDKSGNLKIKYRQEHFDSNFHPETEISISPINLTYEIGIWAIKMKNLGIIYDEVIEKKSKYQEDSERKVYQDGESCHIIWQITIDKDFFILAELAGRFLSSMEDANDVASTFNKV